MKQFAPILSDTIATVAIPVLMIPTRNGLGLGRVPWLAER